jgi:hypothetical protein
MDTLIELCSDGDCIQIELADAHYDWWKWWLQRDAKQPIFLGAESLSILGPRLLAALLGEPLNPAGIIGDKEVYWVLSLAEAHHVLYLAKDQSDTVLYWKDLGAGVGVVGIIRLSDVQKQTWIATLTANGIVA